MLSKKRRLSRKHYITPNTHGRFKTTNHFSMKVISLNKYDESRFSFVVSTKVSKSAVQRNKLRRRGYNVIHELEKNIISGKGVMFYYRRGLGTPTYKVVKKEVVDLLTQACLMK